MITFYNLTHRFKRGLLEITSETSYSELRRFLDPLQNEKLPENVRFKVAAGNKCYDIIRLHERYEEFYSHRLIDVLSQYVDMSGKCYPIKIEDVDEQYYVIYNLKEYSFLNKEECQTMDNPCFWDVNDNSLHLFGIKDTSFIIVSETIKRALLKNKISNIHLTESFGCTIDEYKVIKKKKCLPQVKFYTDK
jgi:hypothetical protein